MKKSDKNFMQNLTLPPFDTGLPALMTRQKWADCIGLPVTVVIAQAERGYWPTIAVGKYCMVNVEAVRIAAARKAEAFTL